MTIKHCEECEHYRSGELFGQLYFGDKRCAGNHEGRWLPLGKASRFDRHCGPERRWWKQAEIAKKLS